MMTTLAEIRAKSTWGDIIEGQLQHLGIVILLTIGACTLLHTAENAPRLLGLTAVGWAKTSITLALIHQFIVAFVFRLQLYKNLMTNLFGASDMKVWAIIFLPLLIIRPITLILTGWADAVPISGYRTAELILGTALLAPAIWGMHSTIKYFTLPRALGGDHFRDSYLSMPMVTGGIFKYTRNGMYGAVFTGLWGIALLFGSWNALVLALFQHTYIWVHMYTTEQPDLRRLFP
ncbi:MAG: hypothetical protein KDA67_02225 [Rhodobacteraceae bacterium]|nr:hypothetical protein [Paracoccaceae bacterium]